jgi:hypothetical protein
MLRYNFKLKYKGIASPYNGHELASALLSSFKVFFGSDSNWKYLAIATVKELLK